MEFKGTKGKWEVMYLGSDLYHNVGINGLSFISTFKNKFLEITNEEDIYNAKLIAAAPELLEEIKGTLIDLKILYHQILSEAKTNHRFEGMPEIIQKWIDTKEELIKKATE